MSITLYSHDPDTGQDEPIATFELKNGKVVSKWQPRTDFFKADIEGAGIVVGAKVLRPKDGKAFYDALPLAFAQSGTMFVK